MDYDAFRKTERYKMFADPMRVAIAMYFLDKDDKGMTNTELTEALKNDVVSGGVSFGLDVFLDTFEIVQETQLRDGFIVQAYKLAWYVRQTFADYVS